MPPSSRPERTRPSDEAILAAAERVFSERGFAATPLRDLIAACQCSTTAFYARYASKEEVLAALIRRLFGSLQREALEALPKARSIHEGCDIGIAILRSKLRGKKGLWRVVLTEAAHTPATRPLVREIYASLATLLSLQLAAARDRGRLAGGDPDALGWAIVGALSLHLTRWCVFEELTHAELVEALQRTAALLLPS